MLVHVSFLATPVCIFAARSFLPVASRGRRATFVLFARVEWALGAALRIAAGRLWRTRAGCVQAVGLGGAVLSAPTPGSLNNKTKELCALANSVAHRCEGCVAYHARGAQRTGARRQEVAEALGVAIQMDGGPSVNYAANALRAFDQFKGLVQ